MLKSTHSRRQFLKQSSCITAGTLLLPSFLQAGLAPMTQDTRLVIVQLSGGNDGLNTIIPYQNTDLLRLRPNLLSSDRRLLKINDELAFNAGFSGFRDLYNQGDVCILNSVGYPNPNRSHFRSMDIWQSASPSDEYLSTGWIGRYLDQECGSEANIGAIEMSDVLSLALKGQKEKGTPLTNVGQFYQATKQVELDPTPHVHSPTADFLYKTAANTQNSAQYLYEKSKIYRSKHNYPNHKFGSDMKEISEMISSGVDAPIYYASLSGFDTHNNQLGRQERLLQMYSETMRIFADDLKSSDRWKNTLVLTFSEFGRRVTQNGSQGTDHGKANNLFLMGGGLKKQGLYNPLPNINQLDQGDLKHEIDFKQVYSTVLNDWLKTDARAIIKGDFKSLNFI
ncbi:DUF1501 domain-containing protein [Reichenbachiella carrageenanivorans]|uniref:DUF1501 domain-containing protein n=1 Tax=Reichenbachiella carrageenanivorans TaxID=2979869 RepID=A0ABY6D0L7_9BACT|nr:DUF1501 domain-containing protein [Reichenbachiella carrageenanivorans]UXX79464.1 DUF1501 domain-containing protein [Reichenbachiella carrageenanivorans]